MGFHNTLQRSQSDPTVGMEPLYLFCASPLPPAFGRNRRHWQANAFLRLIRSLRSQAIRQKEKESARSARSQPRSARKRIPPTESGSLRSQGGATAQARRPPLAASNSARIAPKLAHPVRGTPTQAIQCQTLPPISQFRRAQLSPPPECRHNLPDGYTIGVRLRGHGKQCAGTAPSRRCLYINI